MKKRKMEHIKYDFTDLKLQLSDINLNNNLNQLFKDIYTIHNKINLMDEKINDIVSQMNYLDTKIDIILSKSEKL